MLTISQLAAYAGVTVAAVRHYHQIGLLPEPERDPSGYRSYDSAAVVRLIRIHVLASAGVPLAQVEELLNADAEDFAVRVHEIDKRLRVEVRRLQDTRKRLAGSLPESRWPSLRAWSGISTGYAVLVSTKVTLRWNATPGSWSPRRCLPQIDAMIASKHEDLKDPDMVRLYSLFSDELHRSADDPRVVEAADTLDRLLARTAKAGNLNVGEIDDRFVDLLDATMAESAPAARQLLMLLEERGWKGWTRFERASTANHERSRD